MSKKTYTRDDILRITEQNSDEGYGLSDPTPMFETKRDAMRFFSYGFMVTMILSSILVLISHFLVLGRDDPSTFATTFGGRVIEIDSVTMD